MSKRPYGIVWDHDLVQEMAESGASLADVALRLKVTPQQLKERMAKQSSLADVYRKGRAIAVARVNAVLYQKAMAGDLASIRLFLDSARKGSG